MFLKEDGSLDIKSINNLPIEEHLKVVASLSDKRLREYGKLAYPCGEKFFRRAASIEKRLEKIEVLDKPRKTQTINLNFNFEQRSGNDIVEFNRFSYSIGDKELFKNSNLFVRYKEKVCIMGKNGTGQRKYRNRGRDPSDG